MKTKKELEREMIQEEYEKGNPHALIIAIVLAYVFAFVGIITVGYFVFKLFERIVQ